MLQGRRIVLRPCCDSDLDILLAWRNSEQFRNLCSVRRDIVTLDEFVTELREDFRFDRYVQYMALRARDMYPIGTIYAYNLNLTDGCVFVTLYLEDRFQDAGYGPEVLAVFLHHLFCQHSLHKIYFEVYAYNQMSIRTLQSAGFSQEGCFKEHRLLSGQRYDLFRFAVYYRDLPRLESFLSRLRRGRGGENVIKPNH